LRDRTVIKSRFQRYNTFQGDESPIKRRKEKKRKRREEKETRRETDLLDCARVVAQRNKRALAEILRERFGCCDTPCSSQNQQQKFLFQLRQSFAFAAVLQCNPHLLPNNTQAVANEKLQQEHSPLLLSQGQIHQEKPFCFQEQFFVSEQNNTYFCSLFYFRKIRQFFGKSPSLFAQQTTLICDAHQTRTLQKHPFF
jgi:hypothetical protein